MKALDKAINLVKKYWYLFLVAGSGLAIVITGIFFRGRSKALIDAFMKNREGMMKQVKKIDELHEEANKKKDKAFEEHQEEVKAIEAEKEKKLDEIELEKEKRVEELKDKELGELADKLGKEFDL